MSKLIVALDGLEPWRAEETAKALSGHVWGFKIHDMLHECGRKAIYDLKKYGRVFVDLKLHDIPKTVSNSVRKLDLCGVDLITVHASGGLEMMRAAVEAAQHTKILAVTMLTSLDDGQVASIYGQARQYMAFHLARMAAEAFCYGVTCPGDCVGMMRAWPLTVVVPAIRIKALPGDDQKQVSDPSKVSGDFFVVGRAVTLAEDPLAIVRDLNETFKGVAHGQA